MNAAMFRTVLRLATVVAIVLASPVLAQQRPAAPASPSAPAAVPSAVQPSPPAAAQPAAPPGASTQAAPTAPTPAAAPAPSATAENSSASKPTFIVPRELSPWSMFLNADVVVK